MLPTPLRNARPAHRVLATALKTVALLAVLGAAAPARADDGATSYGITPEMLTLFVGRTGFGSPAGRLDWFGVELRAGALGPWRIVPLAGYARARHETQYLYAGVARDFALGERWTVTASLVGGWFNDSSRLRLGREFEFRTAIELGYDFDGGYRLGLRAAHLSNGGLSERNPGTEALTLQFSIPLAR